MHRSFAAVVILATTIRGHMHKMWALLLFGPTFAFGQMADTYIQAAQKYEAAASACQVPAATACLHQTAAFYTCIANQISANGPSCGAKPSCSTSCVGSSATGTTLPSSAPTIGPPHDQVAQALGSMLFNWSQGRANKKAALVFQEIAKPPIPRNAPEANLFGDPIEQSLPTPDLPLGLGKTDATSAPNATASSQPDHPEVGANTSVPMAAVQGASESDYQSAMSLPSVPSIQTIDNEEVAEANTIGPAWSQELSTLRDQALDQFGSIATSLNPNGVNNDYLKKGAQTVLQDFLPQPALEDATLGSAVQERGVDFASDKLADTLTESKDRLACSGQGSQIEQDACMVFMAPTNMARGLYNYGTILVNRFNVMMTDVNTELLGQPE